MLPCRCSSRMSSARSCLDIHIFTGGPCIRGAMEDLERRSPTSQEAAKDVTGVT